MERAYFDYASDEEFNRFPEWIVKVSTFHFFIRKINMNTPCPSLISLFDNYTGEIQCIY
ncbi:hypothetical protein ACT4UM_19690 [Bacillus sp. SS-TM]